MVVNNNILGALKSAIARGHSIEEAMQTLINSGYPMNEIQEAAQYVQGGQQTQEQPQEFFQPEQPIQTQQPEITKKETLQEKMQKPRRGKFFIIFLILILVLLLGLLITTLIFKEKIAEIILNLFG